MNKKRQAEFLIAFDTIMNQNQISREELKEYLIDVFKKSFGKIYELISYEQRENIGEVEESDIDVQLDFDKFIFSIKRNWIINNKEISFEKLFREINVNSEIVTDKTLKDGDAFIEDINFDMISDSKRRQITQLLIQKSKEKEKEKSFQKYLNLVGKIIVGKVLEIKPSFTLLSYEEETLFLSNYEKSPKDNFNEGDYVKVYVVDVTQINKNTQILVSRIKPQFLMELLAEENEYMRNKIVTIERIARENGIKTKIAVKSSSSSVDPVGSIIGPKGINIKAIISEINNEIIDVVEFSPEPKILIKNLFHPAKVKGIHLNEETRNAGVLVEDNELLQAIGKGGVNVKLVAKITGFKIDVIPRSKMNSVDYKFEILVDNSKNQGSRKMFELEVKSIDELIEDGDKLEEEDADYYDWIDEYEK